MTRAPTLSLAPAPRRQTNPAVFSPGLPAYPIPETTDAQVKIVVSRSDPVVHGGAKAVTDVPFGDRPLRAGTSNDTGGYRRA